jgi:hypothetical protein
LNSINKKFINLLLKDAGYSQDEIDYAKKKIYEGSNSAYGNIKEELQAGDKKNKSK